MSTWMTYSTAGISFCITGASITGHAGNVATSLVLMRFTITGCYAVLYLYENHHNSVSFFTHNMMSVKTASPATSPAILMQ
jgi:hypothetical protein